MKDAGLTPFDRLFPQQAMAEVRVIAVLRHPTLPDDEYGLREFYCDDPACDCRRVLLSVVGRREMAVLASIGYGFDREGAWAGPFLDPLNPQSRHAEALLEPVQRLVLTDPAYVARLEAHRRQVKGADADPSRPAARTPSGSTEKDGSRPLPPLARDPRPPAPRAPRPRGERRRRGR